MSWFAWPASLGWRGVMEREGTPSTRARGVGVTKRPVDSRVVSRVGGGMDELPVPVAPAAECRGLPPMPGSGLLGSQRGGWFERRKLLNGTRLVLEEGSSPFRCLG
jgi:hypothetical protein